MNKQQEYLILDALDRNIVSSRERDVALRALAGNQRAQQQIIPTLTARRVSKFTPTAQFEATESKTDENFDYETGADSGLRALLSFGETSGDREAILTRLVGEDGFTRDSQGRLALTERGQAARDMQPIGKNLVIVDEDFSFGDIADLTGVLPELIGGIGGAILGLPAGLVGSSAGAAAGAAAGQAVEEGIEKLLGVQTQTLSEVGKDVAVEAALAGTFELGGGLIFKAGKAVIGGLGVGAKRLGRSDDITDEALERGERLLQTRTARTEGALPSVERLGGPPVASYQAKFAENVLKDRTRHINNANFALDRADELRAKFGAVSLDDAAQAFDNVTSLKYKALKKTEQEASQASLKAVKESVDLIENSTMVGDDLNDEILSRIEDAFGRVQETAAAKFANVDEILNRVDLGNLGTGQTARIIPTDAIKIKLDDVVTESAGISALGEQTERAINAVRSLPDNASFRQVALSRKALNDALYKENALFTREMNDEIMALRGAMDDAIEGMNLTNIPRQSLNAKQKASLKEASAVRKDAMNYYKDSLKTFEDLERFSIIRDLRNMKNAGRKFEVDALQGRIVRPDAPARLQQVIDALGDGGEEVRSALARSYLDDALTKTGVSQFGDLTTGTFSGNKFLNQINALKGTGKVLFGDQWPEVQRLAETIALAGPDKISPEVVENIVRINSQSPLVDALKQLNEAKIAVGEADRIRVVKAFNEGNLTPEVAVKELTKSNANPSDVRKIIKFFNKDPEALNALRGHVVEDLLSRVGDDVFSNQQAATDLLRVIKKSRKDSVVLDELLGKEGANALEEFAKDLEFLGDVGKEGVIAAQAYTANPINKYKELIKFKALSYLTSNKEALETLVRVQKNKQAGKVAASDRVNSVTSNALAKLGVIENVARVTRQTAAQLGQEAYDSTVEDLKRRFDSMTPRPTAPVASSSLGEVDVMQPLPGLPQTGTNVPVGAQGSTRTGIGGIREMATNNPAVAQALGIRGPTAGLLGRT